MARSLNDIKAEITARYVAEMAAIDETVNPTTWSVTNLQRLFIYVVAFCIFSLEKLFDIFKIEVAETISNKNPHTKNWYKNIVLAYQHGYVVEAGSLQYDNTGISIDDIEASKVIGYCAVTEEADALNIKVAREVSGELAPLSDSQLAGLQEYMEDDKLGQKDAGVFITFVNEDADSLKLSLDVYINPALIDSTGIHIVSGTATTKAAIKNFLKNLAFNGVFTPQDLVDALQLVEGVELIKIVVCQVKADGGSSYQTVDVKYLPNSGYLRIIDDADLTLNFIANGN